MIRLHRGGWDSPDVLLVEADSGTVVVKDFAPRRPFVARTFGRWLIRREIRVLRALDGHPAVPGLLGEIDPLAFVLEHRGGVRFTRRRPWTFSQRFGRELSRAVDAMHARGVVHLDLRHRSNIRADLAGRPVLIDFDSGLAFRPGSWSSRWLFPWLARFDHYCLRKWFGRLAPLAGDVPGGTVSTVGPVDQDSESALAATASVASRGASRPT